MGKHDAYVFVGSAVVCFVRYGAHRAHGTRRGVGSAACLRGTGLRVSQPTSFISLWTFLRLPTLLIISLKNRPCFCPLPLTFL